MCILSTTEVCCRSLIVQELVVDASEDGACILYHYCDFQEDEGKQSIENILRNLLRQRLEADEQFLTEMSEFYDRFKTNRREPNMRELMTVLKAAPPSTCVKKAILVDALDECKDRERLIPVLRELAATFALLVTSRPFVNLNRSLTCLKLQIIATETDLCSFIRGKLSASEDLCSLASDGLQQSIVSTIVSRANGVQVVSFLSCSAFSDT